MSSGDSPFEGETAEPNEVDVDQDAPGFPDRRFVDVSRDPTPGRPGHALPEGAERHPLIDMSRDPTPGVADHALPEDEDD